MTLKRTEYITYELGKYGFPVKKKPPTNLGSLAYKILQM